MGCKGSKPAEAPKSGAASPTLLTKPEEPKAEVRETQAAPPETTPTEVAGNANVETAKETPSEALAQDFAPEISKEEVGGDATAQRPEESLNKTSADATSAKAEEAAETQEPLKSTRDATLMKARNRPSDREQPRTGSIEKATAAPDGVPIAAEKVLAEKVAEAGAASKEEVTDAAVPGSAADAALAGKQGGCFSYCTAAEAQTEIVVQN